MNSVRVRLAGAFIYSILGGDFPLIAILALWTECVRLGAGSRGGSSVVGTSGPADLWPGKL